MMRLLGKLFRDRTGATAVEYGFAVCLIVIALVVGVSSLGGSVSGKWNNISRDVSAVEPM